ncbi:MAG: PilZ domain-containing protein [Hyphomicrobium sp.]
MTNQWSGIDRRQFGRRAVLKHAFIVQGEERTKCIVVDISDGGARIKLEKPEDVPENIALEIPEDDFVVHCQVVHIQSGSIGVKYIRSPMRISWIKKR